MVLKTTAKALLEVGRDLADEVDKVVVRLQLREELPLLEENRRDE